MFYIINDDAHVLCLSAPLRPLLLGLDPAEWSRLHVVLDRAKTGMVARKASSGGGGGTTAKL